MTTDATGNGPGEGAEEAPDSAVPDDEQLEEPSTEKDPGEQPRAPKPDEPQADHEAIGIGVTDPPSPA
ncbi:hypothetical protein GE115_10890 [Agromyces sp. CFH 90414]|uniref:Uncharacterized protein n=1 Tax=Agromyces agglutinans TaxID=2662258 RepID=A0A6I2FCZ7_9MICO|nr:hypothetical protein [Agromyces agglutinans]MRG60366.1 hypothetical protein [Agromyces agglutinans]